MRDVPLLILFENKHDQLRPTNNLKQLINILSILILMPDGYDTWTLPDDSDSVDPCDMHSQYLIQILLQQVKSL